MRKSRTYGSVRGAPGNRRSYRDYLLCKPPTPADPHAHGRIWRKGKETNHDTLSPGYFQGKHWAPRFQERARRNRALLLSPHFCVGVQGDVGTK
jgi:hypothetical protein